MRRSRRPLTLVALALPNASGPQASRFTAIVRHTVRDSDGLWSDGPDGLILVLIDADGPNSEPALARLRMRLRSEGMAGALMGRAARRPRHLGRRPARPGARRPPPIARGTRGAREAPVRVAIVGASGLIGRAVGTALLARGDRVVTLTRGGASGIAGAQDVRWDPAEGPLPSDALEGVDAVVNLAGAPLSGPRWSDERKELIRESRIRTTRMIVDALARDGAPRVLVSGSAVGYYGTGEDERDETDPPGDDFLAATALAWEREAARARASSACAWW